MKTIILLSWWITLLVPTLSAQNVGISADGSLPDPHAMLDIKAADKGLLVPRTSTSTRLGIPNTKGLLLYDTTTSSFWYNDGSSWNNLAGGWLLNGNSNTDPSTNFIGTTDAQPFAVRVNNNPAGYLDVGFPFNSTWGYQTLQLNNGGQANTAFGYQAMQGNSTGFNNTGAGASSLLHNSTGAYNTACGANSLLLNSDGNSNTAVGEKALHNNTTGSANTAVGSGAMFSSLADDNTAVGFQALYSASGINAYNNVAIGWQALYSNTNGQVNTATGANSLHANTDGSDNCALGTNALEANTTGSDNIAIGAQAMYFNKTGSDNVAIGSGATCGDGQVNSIAIGHNANATASNTIRLGDNNITDVISTGSFHVPSDRRLKFNIEQNVKGLDFILKLVPVTYQLNIRQMNALRSASYQPESALDADAVRAAMQVRRSGFIAQDVEQASLEVDYPFDAIHKPVNQKDFYSLNYAQFVVPLVKATQELFEENRALKAKLSSMEERLEALEKR